MNWVFAATHSRGCIFHAFCGHRRKRLKTEVQLPNVSARSRQGAPTRAIQSKGGDIDEECRHLRIGACLSDGHTAPATTDKDNGTLCVCDDAARRGEIILERCQRDVQRQHL
jgi:hypothetical protein